MIDLEKYANLTVYQSTDGHSELRYSFTDHTVTIIAANQEKLLKGIREAEKSGFLTVKGKEGA